HAADPTGYGRLLVEGDRLMAIREHADASPAERKVTLCNAGVMAIDGRKALEILEKIGNTNSKGEYYLVDAVAIARDMGLEAGVKVNHLSYIGDTHVGANTNIGAGTITCNYDGFSKHKTTIGTGAFVGTNSSLVAPVRIGNGAYIGSGSVITKDVPDDALAVERSPQNNREGGAKRFREMKTRTKAPKGK